MLANGIPARLIGLRIVIGSTLLGHPIRAVRAWNRDAQKGSSPNGGIPIVTFAGARDLRLGGDCWSKEGERICVPEVSGRRWSLQVSDLTMVNASVYLVMLLVMVVARFCFT
ncbi:hypothetical protein GF380_03190 [Candidatus Uhrbacteria bacterium]|nr:hypothetical protein [Candidatus Uhrbacteria bacterium]MBD3284147.1 hypothetical protein [Candidatus Uhrbacteria bacterium]